MTRRGRSTTRSRRTRDEPPSNRHRLLAGTVLSDCLQIASGYRPWASQYLPLINNASSYTGDVWIAIGQDGIVAIHNKSSSVTIASGSSWRLNAIYHVA